MSNPSQPVLGMVLKGYPRISETFISNEIGLLEETGFRIHIFSMRKPRESFSHKSIERIKARVTYLPSTLWSSLHRFLLPNLRTYLRYRRNYNQALKLMFRRFARSHKSASIKHVLQAGYLVDKMRGAGDVTHLHAHFAHSPTSVAFYAAMLAGISYSFTGHAKDIYTQKPAQLYEKLARARFVVTCTGYNQKYLQSMVQDNKPVHAVYHGIDLELFKSEHLNLEPAPPYQIMTVARFVEKKGLPTVLKALVILKERGLEFKYVLVGDGEDKAKVERLIAELDLGDQVEMTGTIPHEKVIGLYRQADLFVLGCQVAANGDRDGIPNVLAEAMAMGLPAVATDVSGIPELLINGRTGLSVAPQDPEALAGAMERMLTDRELRARVIPAARQKVREVFDNRRLIRDLAQVYLSEGLGPRGKKE